MSNTSQNPALALSQIADHLAAAAHWAYTNSFAGTSGTNAACYFEWTQKCKLGQLVSEITAYNRPSIDRVGILLSITREPFPEYVDWDEAERGEPAPSRDIWTIECLDGNIMRWENCMFIPVPSKKDSPIQRVP